MLVLAVPVLAMNLAAIEQWFWYRLAWHELCQAISVTTQEQKDQTNHLPATRPITRIFPL